jgi:hypothetical protein
MRATMHAKTNPARTAANAECAGAPLMGFQSIP